MVKTAKILCASCGKEITVTFDNSYTGTCIDCYKLINIKSYNKGIFMNLDINLKIEFLSGTDIESAIKQAAELARKLNIAFCSFNFNGIECSIKQNPNIKQLIKDYTIATSSKYKYIIG